MIGLDVFLCVPNNRLLFSQQCVGLYLKEVALFCEACDVPLSFRGWLDLHAQAALRRTISLTHSADTFPGVYDIARTLFFLVSMAAVAGPLTSAVSSLHCSSSCWMTS